MGQKEQRARGTKLAGQARDSKAQQVLPFYYNSTVHTKTHTCCLTHAICNMQYTIEEGGITQCVCVGGSSGVWKCDKALYRFEVRSQTLSNCTS